MIYISHDSGATWIARANSSGGWNGIACSCGWDKAGGNQCCWPDLYFDRFGTNWIARHIRPVLFGRCLLGGRDKAGGGRRRWLHLYFDRFRHELDRLRINPAMVERRFHPPMAQSWWRRILLIPISLSSSFSIGEIYTSADSGTPWTALIHWTAPPQNWTSVAQFNLNGTCLAAVALNAVLYEIDSSCAGIIYTNQLPERRGNWLTHPTPSGVRSPLPADGTKLTAANGNGF